MYFPLSSPPIGDKLKVPVNKPYIITDSMSLKFMAVLKLFPERIPLKNIMWILFCLPVLSQWNGG